MPNLQVKNVPDGMYAALRERAAGSHTTVRDYVLRLVEDDLAIPAVGDWLAEVGAARPSQTPPDDAVRRALDGAADDLDAAADR